MVKNAGPSLAAGINREIILSHPDFFFLKAFLSSADKYRSNEWVCLSVCRSARPSNCPIMMEYSTMLLQRDIYDITTH